MPSYELELRYWEIDGQKFPTVEYADSPSPLCVAIFGEIFPVYWGRSKGENEAEWVRERRKMEIQKWKLGIAKAIGERRGNSRWDSDRYIISICFVFGPNGPRASDVDNHIKPIVDATATALFEPNLKGFLKSKIDDIETYHKTGKTKTGKRWARDDHRFKTVFAHRLPNAGRTVFGPGSAWGKEGIAICISPEPQRTRSLRQIYRPSKPSSV